MTFVIAYDVKAMKVGCVLIQVGLGGTVPSALFHEHFPSETWTVNATNCRLYPVTEAQLSVLAAKSERAGVRGLHSAEGVRDDEDDRRR